MLSKHSLTDKGVIVMFTLSQSLISAAPRLTTALTSSAAQSSATTVTSQPPRLWPSQHSNVPLNEILHAPIMRVNWDQLADQSDADRLQVADQLVKDATGLVGGRAASPIDHIRAQAEMAQASAIRQSVGKDLEARYPSNGPGFGGELVADQIQQADAEEQRAFQLVQSSNPADISEGATDLMAASSQFQLIEASLRP
jgi:hypothetical protein